MKKLNAAQKFIALVNEYKESINEVNGLVDFIEKRQEGRELLSSYRTKHYESQENYEQHNKNFENARNQLAQLAMEYFVRTTALEGKKRRKLTSQMQPLAFDMCEEEVKKDLEEESLKLYTKKINQVTEALGDCDTNLESAIRDYYTAVNKYNALSAAINNIAGSKIKSHSTDNITPVPEFDINTIFANISEEETENE